MTQPRCAALAARTLCATASQARSAPKAAARVLLCLAVNPHALRSGCNAGSPAPYHGALVLLSSVACHISALHPERRARGITEKLECSPRSRGREASGARQRPQGPQGPGAHTGHPPRAFSPNRHPE